MDGRAVTAVEADSSPSRITAKHGSAVYLHWAYTYIGDGTYPGMTFKYIEQSLGFNSTSHPDIQILAFRSRPADPLKLAKPLPAAFTGRVEVIASNSTLVINNLGFIDTIYEYFSFVKIQMVYGPGIRNIVKFPLKPIVKVTVTGMTLKSISFQIFVTGSNAVMI